MRVGPSNLNSPIVSIPKLTDNYAKIFNQNRTLVPFGRANTSIKNAFADNIEVVFDLTYNSLEIPY